MSCLTQTIKESLPKCHPLLAKLDQVTKLSELLPLVWSIGMMVAVELLQEVLSQRAHRKTEWPRCPKCQKRLESKGWAERHLNTILGSVQWSRRIGRCPQRCVIGQVVPFDEELGLAANQKSETGLQRLACLLVVFVPYAIAETILSTLLGTRVSRSTLWNWVQEAGQRAEQRLNSELEQLAQGVTPPPEASALAAQEQILLIGADGVMAPFRPTKGSAKGQVQWREVKVGIFARWQQVKTRSGEWVGRLGHRRVVATLGNTARFAQQMALEGHKQGVSQAPQVAWLSDGGRGLWRLFGTTFARWATPILDFYHVSQNIWAAAQQFFKGEALSGWFTRACHALRHGESQELLREIEQLAFRSPVSEEKKKGWLKVHHYLDKHRNHLEYDLYKEMGFPIGSGFVESACKWIVQQRMKGVGMRWSEDGFNHLLHLRVAWVNQRFDLLFSSDGYSPKL